MNIERILDHVYPKTFLNQSSNMENINWMLNREQLRVMILAYANGEIITFKPLQLSATDIDDIIKRCFN